MITRMTFDHSEEQLAIIAEQMGSKKKRASRKEVMAWVERVCAAAMNERPELELDGGGPKCESCDAAATTRSLDDVPLCEECATELSAADQEDAAKEADEVFGGDAFGADGKTMKVKATGSILRVESDLGGMYLMTNGDVLDEDEVEPWP